ncbi:phage tail protein [Acinetobacter sp. ANC 4636]
MTEKIVYQYDTSGLYLGTTVADESPLQQGVFHLPAHCTETPVPTTWAEDQHPRWDGCTWQLVAKPKLTVAESPEQKLADFLKNNPDVVKLINT